MLGAFNIHEDKNRVLLGSSLILLLIYSCILYGSINWGTDLPTVLIALFLSVLMTGILINSKAGFIWAVLLSIHLGIFNYIQSNSILKFDYEWKRYLFNVDDVVEYSILLIFASFFYWLSNNQLEKSLARSRKAELKLQQERDHLELTVNERTQEIKKMQIDKINSMYRLVEFGRISSGLFHDIINPLTDININIQLLKIEEAKESIKHLIPSIKRMDYLISQSKKHIKIEDEHTTFDTHEEIASVIELLNSKSIKNGVKVVFLNKCLVKKINGSQTLFSHIIMNLLSNAIDSHCPIFNDGNIEYNKNKIVTITAKNILNKLQVKVSDNGHGMNELVMEKIFEPFYTTKHELGCGIGLSATKHILEKYFNGDISVKSRIHKGTSFLITIPIDKE